MRIPNIVLRHLEGADIYADSDYSKNSLPIQQRALEDAEFLIALQFDGYEDFSAKAKRDCIQFAKLARIDLGTRGSK